MLSSFQTMAFKRALMRGDWIFKQEQDVVFLLNPVLRRASTSNRCVVIEFWRPSYSPLALTYTVPRRWIRALCLGLLSVFQKPHVLPVLPRNRATT